MFLKVGAVVPVRAAVVIPIFMWNGGRNSAVRAGVRRHDL
jgi:hypothetical protein